MYAKINGTRIFFDVEGLQFVPDGPILRERPVCFLMHGGPGSDHSGFLPECSELADTMQLVYVDDRNTGRSERGDVNMSSLKQNVEDLEALREYLGLDKIFILGVSYGGMKAQEYITAHPEHLYGAILVSTGARADVLSIDRVAAHIKDWGTQEQYDLWVSDALQKGTISFHDYMDIMGPLYHGPGKFKLQEYRDSNARQMKSDEVHKHQRGAGGELNTYNYLPKLKDVDLPCMVIAGKYDFITDLEANREIAETIPGAEFHVIEGASHSLLADFPEVAFPLIRDFVTRNFKK